MAFAENEELFSVPHHWRPDGTTAQSLAITLIGICCCASEY
jgi:hypothetical protein